MSEATVQPVIEIREVTKVYRMGDVEVHALSGASLRVEPGEMVSIMGPSGSGKSTLMNIIGCLDQTTSGQYLLDGIDVSSLLGLAGAVAQGLFRNPLADPFLLGSASGAALAVALAFAALGAGGMGEVWLARHRELGTEVALKVLPAMPPEQIAGVRERFFRVAPRPVAQLHWYLRGAGWPATALV